MPARLIFSLDGREHERELPGFGLTIGRGKDCELQINDERISTQHCRLTDRDGEWLVIDGQSTNKTFVNDEVVERSHKLAHGDVLRLGPAGAPLFEARFVTRDAPQPRAEQSAAHRVVELEAALHERDAELARIGGLYKQAQARLAERNAAAAAELARRGDVAGELDDLRAELAELKASAAAHRDELRDARAEAVALEARLADQERQARSRLNDSEQRRAKAERELGTIAAELTATKQALAVAVANVDTLKAAHDDVLTRLSAFERAD